MSCAIGAIGQARIGTVRTPAATGFDTVLSANHFAVRSIDGSVIALAELSLRLRAVTDPAFADAVVDALLANAPRGGWSGSASANARFLSAIVNSASWSGTAEEGERRVAAVLESMTGGRFIDVRRRHAFGERVEVRPVAIGSVSKSNARPATRLAVRSVTLDGVEPADLELNDADDSQTAFTFLPDRTGTFTLRVERTLSIGATTRRAAWWSRDFVEERTIEVVGSDEPLLVPTRDADLAPWRDPSFEWELALRELGDEQAICLVVYLRDRADIAVVGSWWLAQDDREVELGQPLRAVGAHPNQVCVWSGGTVTGQPIDRSRSMILRFVPDPDAIAHATAVGWTSELIWDAAHEIRVGGFRTRWRRESDGWHSTMARRE